MAAVDPSAKTPEALGLLIHVIVGRKVGQDEMMRAQAGDGNDRPIDSLRLELIHNPESNGIVIGRGFEITVAFRAKHPMVSAVRVERSDEVAFRRSQERQAAAGQVASFGVESNLGRTARE